MCAKVYCVLLLIWLPPSSASAYQNVYSTSPICRKLDFENDCSLNEWRCNEGTCVRINSECDGIVDCPDGSDETFELCRNRVCGPFKFRCNYGACVEEASACNNVHECNDQSDELLPKCLGDTIIEGEEKFKCRDGQLIPLVQRCDGVAQCADRSDETVASCAELVCGEDQFQCEYGGCVHAAAQCNHTIECNDGSDEKLELCGVLTLVWSTITEPEVKTASKEDGSPVSEAGCGRDQVPPGGSN